MSDLNIVRPRRDRVKKRRPRPKSETYVSTTLLLIKPLHADLLTAYEELRSRNLLKVADSFNDFIAGLLAASLQNMARMKARQEAESRLVKLPSEL